MNKPLWTPAPGKIKTTQIYQFQKIIEKQTGQQFSDYNSFHRWSVENKEDFWESVWIYSEIIASESYSSVLDNASQFPGAQWFSGARLNFAENLLRYRDDRTALVSLLENGTRTNTTYAELFEKVEQLTAALRQQGVKVGDRVVGFMPNITETVIAMLATSSIGAIWSSCSPDFGIQGVVDRFGQIEPKVLFAADGYFYNEKTIHSLERIKEIQRSITSIEKTVIIPIVDKEPDLADLCNAVCFSDYLVTYNTPALDFEQLPFNHPLYIMYSSGTTGVPKCIVHGAGGSLIQHLKEHKLHTDIRRDDVLFYFTTCGWMMWNWLVSGLACGSTILLYDGSPMIRKGGLLIDAIDNEHISVFGTSAKFISTIEKSGIKPAKTQNLESLRTILSTGSPLSHESFDYIYRDFKQDVCLSSICGGTDIISCFMLGNPTLPVFQGELQCRGLGMAVEVWNDRGESVVGEKGELVCTEPFPSCPIGFWNDDDGQRFHSAYFELYDNIWAQGDYAEITENGGVIVHGRSDAILNPGGVRIGTAEIYRQVEKIPQIVNSIVIGQQWHSDVRVVLFVVLQEGLSLTDDLFSEIKHLIRTNTTPRHVPEKIIQVADIPRTISGKIVELAVRNVVHGLPVKNTEALANPEALEYFRALPELQK